MIIRRRRTGGWLLSKVSRRGLLIAVAAVSALVPFAVAASADDKVSSAIGIVPGSEKERLLYQAEAEALEASRSTLAPSVGRPTEQWQPSITSGIDTAVGNPFEGSSFLVLSMWQSDVDASGTVTSVYVGTDGELSKIVLTRRVVMTGITDQTRFWTLPPKVGEPKIIEASAKGILTVMTASGLAFSVDVWASTVSPN